MGLFSFPGEGLMALSILEEVVDAERKVVGGVLSDI